MTDKSQNDLRHQVIHIIGELVLDEMEWQAKHLKHEGAAPSHVQIFEAVRDDLVNEIRITNPEEQKLYHWARSGCLYASLWEQYARLHPEHEPWPENTQAAQWRAVEDGPAGYYMEHLSQEEIERKLARMKAELPPERFAQMKELVTLLTDGQPHSTEEMANVLQELANRPMSRKDYLRSQSTGWR